MKKPLVESPKPMLVVPHSATGVLSGRQPLRPISILGFTAGYVGEQSMSDCAFGPHHPTHSILGYPANPSADVRAIIGPVEAAQANCLAMLGPVQIRNCKRNH